MPNQQQSKNGGHHTKQQYRDDFYDDDDDFTPVHHSGNGAHEPMDESGDGTGWNAAVENYSSFIAEEANQSVFSPQKRGQQPQQGGSGVGKPLMSVSVADLAAVVSNSDESLDDGRFTIAGQPFDQLKLLAKVVGEPQRQQGMTIYTVSDANEDGHTDDATRFTVIDNVVKNQLKSGDGIFVVGKLQSFNDELSLLGFHVRAVEQTRWKGELMLHKAERRLAQIYYKKFIYQLAPHDLDELGYADTIFSPYTPVQRQRQQGQPTPTQQPRYINQRGGAGFQQQHGSTPRGNNR